MIVDTELDLDPVLKRLASIVEPTAGQKDAASRSHNNLRNLLSDGHFGRKLIDSYLSGSYSRDTAIHPIDDVDVVFLIRPEAWREGGFLFSDYPAPADVLRSFATALRRRYPQTTVYTQRRSVRLALNHLDIDVVPAIPLEDSFIKIPDTENSNWIKSGPAIHKQIGALINTRTRGVFKPTVKLVKYWNSTLPSTAQLKSFTVESMAMALFRQHRVDGLFDSVLSFFDFMAQLAGEDTTGDWSSDYGIDLGFMGPIVPDPSGATSNVARGVDSDIVNNFLERAVKGRDLLLEAAESSRLGSAERAIAKAMKFQLVT